ncbi:hypothetical protein [Portibacter marinus]|uniref:hypothetical protein n=1 Tax=Portibacter marinus TaxID=2898660 RepID=UPI001F39E58C|nr:hypothetical protein [Portibacter marinus]
MKNLKVTTFLFTIIILVSGCYKDNIMFEPDDIEVPVLEIKGNIENFFSAVAEQPISSSFNAEEGIQIITPNQTVIQVFENSLVDQSGNLVQGDVNFSYLEILNAPEYAFYNLPTISDGIRLRTEGVFRFEAYQDGKPLAFKDGKGIVVRLPDNEPESDMQLFYGDESGDRFNWVPVNESNTGVNPRLEITEWFFQVDSLEQDFVEGFGYLFTCDLFKWINVDIFADVAPEDKTEVCVELPEIYTNKNTVVFMYFDGRASILGLYPDADNMNWCESYGATPIGYDITLFSISDQGEDTYHFGLEETKVTKDLRVFIEPEEKSLDEILEVIKSLE